MDDAQEMKGLRRKEPASSKLSMLIYDASSSHQSWL